MESPQDQTDLIVNDELNSYFVGKHTWIGPILSVMYLIVTKLLHQYMANKPAYSLKTAMRIYNLIQIYACIKHVLMIFERGLWWSFIVGRNAPKEFINDFYKEIVYIATFYFYLKLLDLFDTLFIVLKKKSNQLSFLHLFHHCSMISATHFIILEKDVFLLPCILLNSLVHTFMYSYFFVASFSSQKWIYNYKKFITQLQLIQFGLASLYILYIVLAGCQLKTNSIFISYLVLGIVSYEFGKFYITQYIKKKK